MNPAFIQSKFNESNFTDLADSNNTCGSVEPFVFTSPLGLSQIHGDIKTVSVSKKWNANRLCDL